MATFSAPSRAVRVRENVGRSHGVAECLWLVWWMLWNFLEENLVCGCSYLRITSSLGRITASESLLLDESVK